MGHGAYAQPVVVAFDVHLVVPFQFAGAHRAHLLDREIEDHGLLDPLVDLPLAAREGDGFGRAQKPLVDEFHHLADGGFGRIVLQQGAVVPRPFDGCSEFVVHNLYRFYDSQSYANLLSFPTLWLRLECFVTAESDERLLLRSTFRIFGRCRRYPRSAMFKCSNKFDIAPLIRIFGCALDTPSRHNQADACFCLRFFVSLSA